MQFHRKISNKNHHKRQNFSLNSTLKNHSYYFYRLKIQIAYSILWFESVVTNGLTMTFEHEIVNRIVDHEELWTWWTI